MPTPTTCAAAGFRGRLPRRGRSFHERLTAHTEAVWNLVWVVGGFVTGFLISDVWHTWWNLTLPLGFIAMAMLFRYARWRRERDSNSRG